MQLYFTTPCHYYGWFSVRVHLLDKDHSWRPALDYMVVNCNRRLAQDYMVIEHIINHDQKQGTSTTWSSTNSPTKWSLTNSIFSRTWLLTMHDFNTRQWHVKENQKKTIIEYCLSPMHNFFFQFQPYFIIVFPFWSWLCFLHLQNDCHHFLFYFFKKYVPCFFFFLFFICFSYFNPIFTFYFFYCRLNWQWTSTWLVVNLDSTNSESQLN